MSLSPALFFNLALLGATILTAGLASWVTYHRARGSIVFTLLMLALGWWSCAYALELSSTDLATAIFWGKLQYLPISIVPALWLLFGLRYSGHNWPGLWGRIGLAVIPLLTLALVWTNEAHGLLWSSAEQRTVGAFRLLILDYGLWFWVCVVYSYALVLAGSTLLLTAAWGSAPMFRRQSTLLACGALLPLVGNLLYLTNLSPVPGLDLTSLLFTGSALFFVWASLRYPLATISPVACHQLFEQMADVVVVLDDHGQIADLNPAGRQLFGVPQAFGRQLTVVAPALAANLSSADPAPELTVGTGETARTYDVQRTALTNWSGEQSGALIVLRDISVRKRGEARLHAQKELFAALTRLAHAAAARPTLPETLDSILGVASELTGASRGSVSVFAEDSAVVQSVLVHGLASPVAEQRAIERVLDDGLAGWAVRQCCVALASDTDADSRWLTLPDQPYPVGSALAVPILEGDHVLGLIMLTHETRGHFKPEQAELMEAAAAQIGMAVRNAQMYENQRQLAERAEAASRAKSTFLATVSHELRTPLNVIIGYSELLSDDLRTEASGEQVAHLGQISGAGRQLLNMVNDMLELARIEAGQAGLALGPVDLAALARNVVAITRPLAAQNGNVLDLDCPDNLGVIISDLGKTRQILLQLLSNACKFTEHGRITLTVRPEPDAMIAFQIADTGIGIAEEQLPALFDDFTQGDGSTTRRYGGVGLGLALSQHLCRLLGGTISVNSRVGHGSTFVLRLPTHPGEQTWNAYRLGVVSG